MKTPHILLNAHAPPLNLLFNFKYLAFLWGKGVKGERYIELNMRENYIDGLIIGSIECVPHAPLPPRRRRRCR